MGELTRPNQWKRFKESARAHKGLILVILIVLAALILVMLIYEEEQGPTGRVVDETEDAGPLQEVRDAKTTYDDVIVNPDSS